jgi:hypothetical protein
MLSAAIVPASLAVLALRADFQPGVVSPAWSARRALQPEARKAQELEAGAFLTWAERRAWDCVQTLHPPC